MSSPFYHSRESCNTSGMGYSITPLDLAVLGPDVSSRLIKVIGFLAFVLLAHRIIQRIYNIHFHPLRNFRGPPGACKSDAWLYHTSKAGFPEEEFDKLHQELNTRALRVAPNELHLSDVKLYKTIYSQTSPFMKDPKFYAGFNTPHTVFVETDPALHKERRRLLSSQVSRAAVFKLEIVMREKIFALANKINRLCKTKPINTYNAFRLLTTEIIMQFAFARAPGLMEEDPDEFHSWFLDSFDLTAASVIELQYRPWLRYVINAIPPRLVHILNPKIGNLLDLIKYAGTSLECFKTAENLPSHPVIFEALPSVPDELKVAEAMDFLIAGSDTTASTLTVGIYHILKNPQFKAKLTQVLDESFPRDIQLPALFDLEKIDYLNACVKESLRIAMATPGRLPRVVPENLSPPLVVDGQVIPAGTIVSMSAYTMHYSTELWGPHAREFNPDRWLNGKGKGLDPYMVAFSKGSRMCLGQNLAPAEITLILGFLFREYDMRLVEGQGNLVLADHFTLAILDPGVHVLMAPRVK